MCLSLSVFVCMSGAAFAGNATDALPPGVHETVYDVCTCKLYVCVIELCAVFMCSLYMQYMLRV